MPAALLAGAFGQGNLGDDALLQAFVQALPDWDISVTSDDPTLVEELGCRPVSAHRRAAVARTATRADAIVVGGGTVFKILHPSSNRRPHALLTNTSALIAISSATRRPVALIGVGVGALPDRMSRVLARFIVRHSDLLILRDEESATELIGAGTPGPLRVGADPAWTLLTPPDAHIPRDGTVRIIPSVFAIGDDGWDGMIARTCETIRLLLAAGIKVELQAWDRAPYGSRIDDGHIVEALARQVGPSVEVIPRPPTIAAAVQSMAGSRTVVSFRLHAVVAAAAAGVPAVAVAHETKLSAMARRLAQATAPVNFEPASLARLVTHAMLAPSPAPAIIKEQIDLAEESFRLLRVLLAGGRSDEADSLGALPLASSPPAS
jgi:polysaccharide pyruvyl transferase WcaK-like protein